MDFLLNEFAWLVIGVVLMIAELIIPGGVIFFLGAACVVVGSAIWVGLVTAWTGALTLFFVTSLLLVIGLRAVVSRFAEGDSSKGNTLEILDDIDSLVEVDEAIGPGDVPGVVTFRGTQWKAVGDGAEIPAGDQARVVSRENITLVVVPAQPSNQSADQVE
jgi:membrane protein implicated in regulation of membrane protease activity